MKAKLFFASLAATALLSGCSSDEPVITPGGGDAIGEPQFLAVNIVTSGESATKTRADKQVSGEPTNDNNEKATYEEGNMEENLVTSIRFYFFNGDNAAFVKKGEGENWLNYLDWTDISYPESPGDKDMPNVEKILNTMLILQTPNDDKMPETMVAIINPTDDLPKESISLTNLKKKYGDYDNYISKGTFVMSNSTYANTDNKAMMEVNVKEHILTSSDAAKKAPVDVYVERTVAKIRLKSGLTSATLNGMTLYDPSPKKDGKVDEDNEQKFGDVKIYVKFLGWNATAVADKSRLMKKINPEWKGTLLGDFGPWNWEPYSRSFWAFNVSRSDNETDLHYQYGAFLPSTGTDANAANLFQAKAKEKFDGTQWVYVNENASDDYENGFTASTPTKVIIAAQLVSENGTAIEFAEYGTERMSVEALTTRFANLAELYKKTTDNNGNEVYTKIAPADLVIKTATAVNNGVRVDIGSYKVYVQLSDNAKEAEWYSSNKADQTEQNKLSADQANQTLMGFGAAKVWKNGYTYYYFDIEHGSKDMKGVVRNHIYDATLTSLKGLGTPVYDPDEIIYPEKPTPDKDSYLAASIKILSWRVVNNNVALEW